MYRAPSSAVIFGTILGVLGCKVTTTNSAVRADAPAGGIRTFTVTVQANSFLGKVGSNTGEFSDDFLSPAPVRFAANKQMQVLAAVTDQGFAEDPQDGTKDTACASSGPGHSGPCYRIWSQATFNFGCDASDNVTGNPTMDLQAAAGKEGPFNASTNTPDQHFDPKTGNFWYAVSGGPPMAADAVAQAIALRDSKIIYHVLSGNLFCNRGVGSVSVGKIQVTKMPSFRGWRGVVETTGGQQTVIEALHAVSYWESPQSEFTELWFLPPVPTFPGFPEPTPGSAGGGGDYGGGGSTLPTVFKSVSSDVGTVPPCMNANPAGQLAAGGQIANNQSLCSPGNKYALSMQNDGNLVVYQLKAGGGGHGTLATMTNGNSTPTTTYATIQTDGNFVVYSAPTQSPGDKAIWATMSSGANSVLSISDAGVVEVKNGGGSSTFSTDSSFLRLVDSTSTADVVEADDSPMHKGQAGDSSQFCPALNTDLSYETVDACNQAIGNAAPSGPGPVSGSGDNPAGAAQSGPATGGP
jgi:hypothetical protein